MEVAFTSLCWQLGQARHTTVPGPKHVSEVTPWLRRTQFHIHLSGLGPVAFTAAYQLPKAASGEAALALICGSADRVLQLGLQRLHHVDRQPLNCFQEHVTSQVLLGRPQEPSMRACTAVFQKAACFFFRVKDGGVEFERPLFAATQRQRDAAGALMAEATAQVDAAGAEGQDEEDRRLDQLTLAFCINLIQQRLVDEVFAEPAVVLSLGRRPPAPGWRCTATAAHCPYPPMWTVIWLAHSTFFR